MACRARGFGSGAFALVWLWWSAVGADGAELYVSPTGRDEWTGRQAAPNQARTDGPFATLGRACREVRAVAEAGLVEPLTVYLRGGEHLVAATVELGEDVAGTEACPVVIAAYPGEQPVLVGAKRVSGWRPYRNGIWQADLKGLGAGRFRNLFFQGLRQLCARYPNVAPDAPPSSGWAFVDQEKPAADVLTEHGAKRVLRVREGNVRRWAHPEQAQVFIYPTHEWWNNIVPVREVSPDGRTLVLGADCSYEISAGDRYYVLGLPEEIDQPGEWAIDAAGEAVFFLPPSTLDRESVWIPVVRTMLRLSGSQHVTVRGLTFQYADGTAVVLDNAENCSIAACTVRQVGDYNGSGIAVRGGRGNRVVGCDVHDVGHTGIQLSGGDVKTLTPAENVAENNHVFRTGVFYKQGSGIRVLGVGNRAVRNTIHHVPRFAIQFGGNRNVIEANHLHHASLETSDTGAIYGGSLDWISGHGTIIRHNYIHDVVGFGRRGGRWQSPFFAWGIYLDWSAMGVTVTGNIIARAPRAGIMVHDGRFNRIENNIVVDCGFGQYDEGSQIEASGWHVGHFFWKRGMEAFHWVDKYESVAGLPAWRGEGSTLRDPRNTALPDGRTMHSNRFGRNILSYSAPNSQAFRFRNVSYEHNPSDRNLLWHHGKAVKTGLPKVGKARGPNLVPNAGFVEGELGKTPVGWRARLPLPASEVASVAEPTRAGGRAMRLRGAASPELAGRPVWQRCVMAESQFVPVIPGKAYQLVTWLRADKPGTSVRLEALSYKGGAYDVRFPKSCRIGTEWTEHSVVLRLPEPATGAYHDGMEDTFYVRVILEQDEGMVWVGDVELREAELVPEWDAWQAEGMDRHSVVADPLFVDPAADDFRLRPESPAWGLGFEPVPTDRIGCYQDPLRASWPLRE